MSLFTQLGNKLAYSIHSLTYDPEAEKFAAAQKAKEAAAEAAIAKAKADGDAKAVAAAQKKKDDDEAAAKEEAAKERAKFDIVRLLGRVFGIVSQIVGIFLILSLCVLGSSLATNLNVYHEWPTRLLYAIYGFLFFWLVIPYVLLYRWYWKGLRPRYYALVPLVPYHFDNYYAALLFSWLSFKPDDVIPTLEEWKKT